MKHLLLCFLIFCAIPFLAWGQEPARELTRKEKRKARPAYLQLGTGIESGVFRDFATSPLFYNGAGLATTFAVLRRDEQQEINWGIESSVGQYQASVGEHLNVSTKTTVALYYSRLYRLSKLTTEKWNTRVGAMFNAMGNLRLNPSLGNNTVGLEGFFTIFGSAQTTFTWNTVSKQKKLLYFIKYRQKARKRQLSYRLNVGVVNNTYRNGFVYIGQEALLNSDKLLGNYEYKNFSGFRMSSSLNYTIHLPNKNAFQFSYLWDVTKTGGSLDKFEMAHHTVRSSLLFNLK